MIIEARLAELKIVVPTPARPVGAYVPALVAGDLAFTSGQLPVVDGVLKFKGKLGREISLEDGYQAARLCAINCLGALASAVGNLDWVEQIVKVTGFVASAEGFTDQPKVVNGASELLEAIFGEKGKHARSAVGVAELPLGAPVEIEVVARFK
ncbi:MAG: RidA family protein [Syntrophothermus sp.]